MGPYLYRSGFKEKKFQLDLNSGPRGSRPGALPAHVYCNVPKYTLLYQNNFSAVVMNLAHFHTPKIIPIYTQGRSNKFESLGDCFEAQNA